MVVKMLDAAYTGCHFEHVPGHTVLRGILQGDGNDGPHHKMIML